MNRTVQTVFEILAYCALIAAPLCLLYVDWDMFFPYITGKNFVWRGLVEIAFVGWASLALLSAKYRINWRQNYVLIAISIFVALAFISNMQGINPYRSFWGNAERMDGFLSLIHLYMYFVALLGLLHTKNMFHWYLHWLVLIGFIVGFDTLNEERERVHGTLGNPIYLGSLSFFCIFICAYFACIKKEIWNTAFLREEMYGALILFFLYTLFASGTRGALLGIGVGALIAAIIILINTKYRDEPIWWSISITSVISFMGFSLLFIFRSQLKDIEFIKNIELFKRFTQVSLEDNSTASRLVNWKMAIEGSLERPFLGWGQESYLAVFSKYFDSAGLYASPEWFDRVHNALLDWLIFTGYVGVSLFLMIFATALYVIWKCSAMLELSNTQKAILTGAIFAYLVQNITAFDSLVSGIYIFFILSFVAFAQKTYVTATPAPVKSKKRDKKQKKVSADNPVKIAPLIIIPMIIGTGIWINYSIVQPYQHSRDYINFLRIQSQPQDKSRHNQIADSLINVLSKNTQFTGEFILSALATVPNIFQRASVNIDIGNRMIDKLDEKTKEYLEGDPNEVRILKTYALFLNAIGRHDEAETYIDRAIAASPSKFNLYWVKAEIHRFQKRKEDQLAALKAAYELAPELPRAKFLYNSAKEQSDAQN